MQNQSSENEISPLSKDDIFRFACHKKVKCFNECCKDLNQFLTPYDVLRLKRHVGLSSTEFLEQYTLQHIGPGSGLPVVTFKTERKNDYICPFVTPEGCHVYKDRPGSCRTYPLARVVTRSKETGHLTEYYFMMEEPHCRGFEESHTQTVDEWIKSQEMDKYNEFNDMLMEIIGMKNQFCPGPLDATARQLFYQACYDIDAFRKQIFENNLYKDFSEDAELMTRIQSDDEALLRSGMQWLKRMLFHV